MFNKFTTSHPGRHGVGVVMGALVYDFLPRTGTSHPV